MHFGYYLAFKHDIADTNVGLKKKKKAFITVCSTDNTNGIILCQGSKLVWFSGYGAQIMLVAGFCSSALRWGT